MKLYKIIKKAHIPLLFLTPVRAVVILITPYFAYWMKKNVKFKLSNVTKLLFTLFVVSSVCGLFGDTDTWQNVLVACLIQLPIIYLFSCKYIDVSKRLYRVFILYSTFFLVLVDIGGFFAFILYHVRGEDSFGLLYGRHFTSVHGLSLLNALFFFFFFLNNFFKKDMYNRGLSAFFLVSFIMCFYGLGLVSFVFTLGLFFILNVNPKKFILGAFLVFLSLFFIIKFNESNLNYVERKINEFEIGITRNYDAPRKVQFVRTAIKRYSESSIIEKMMGFGPGAYNGRVASLLGEDSDNPFTQYLGSSMPKYYRSDVYRYWNKSFVSVSNFNDGTINKPHSSLISIFMENGTLFGILFIGLWIKRLFFLGEKRSDSLYGHLFLVNLFFLFNFITEQWFETSEFLFFVIYNSLTIAYKKRCDNSIILNKYNRFYDEER